MLAAGSAASLAALLIWLGPPGNDLAAHVYQRTVFLHHGFQLWNNFWYGGRYSFVTYSVVYYPLAAVFGIRALAIISIGIAALAFAIVVCREFELMCILTFCVFGALLAWRVEHSRTLRWFFIAYGVVSLATYAFTSPLGENIARVRLVALPIAVLVLSLRRWRPLPVAALVL